MPAWLLPVRVYLDTLWVFLVLTFSASHGVTFLINPSAWVSERRIIVWFNDTREGVFSHFHPLEAAWDGAMWALRTVFGGAAVPLIWLAVACIVYGATVKPDWHAAARRVGGDRIGRWLERSETARTQLSSGWKRVPGKVRTEVREQITGQLGKFKPITDSAHVIAAGGIFAVSLYVLAYLSLAWLDMSGSFFRAQLIGIPVTRNGLAARPPRHHILVRHVGSAGADLALDHRAAADLSDRDHAGLVSGPQRRGDSCTAYSRSRSRIEKSGFLRSTAFGSALAGIRKLHSIDVAGPHGAPAMRARTGHRRRDNRYKESRRPAIPTVRRRHSSGRCRWARGGRRTRAASSTC